jgi:hypothetical protein
MPVILSLGWISIQLGYFAWQTPPPRGHGYSQVSPITSKDLERGHDLSPWQFTVLPRTGDIRRRSPGRIWHCHGLWPLKCHGNPTLRKSWCPFNRTSSPLVIFGSTGYLCIFGLATELFETPNFDITRNFDWTRLFRNNSIISIYLIISKSPRHIEITDLFRNNLLIGNNSNHWGKRSSTVKSELLDSICVELLEEDSWNFRDYFRRSEENCLCCNDRSEQ